MKVIQEHVLGKIYLLIKLVTPKGFEIPHNPMHNAYSHHSLH